MKNVKVKIISGLISASLLIPTITTLAEETTNTPSNGELTKQQKLENKQNLAQYKGTIKSKKAIIKENNATLDSLRKEVSEKRATIKSLISDVKENKKQLSKDDLSKIKAQVQVIKNQTAALASTKGTIKQALETMKNAIKNKSYQEAIAQLDKIISIQNTRIDGLKKLSTDMDTLISLLKTALTNAKTT